MSSKEKPLFMKYNNIIRVFLLAIAVTGTFLVLHSAQGTKANSCKESMDDCSKKQKNNGIIWEDLSHQFFSSF